MQSIEKSMQVIQNLKRKYITESENCENPELSYARVYEIEALDTALQAMEFARTY